jgi:hypothetical protein
MILYICHNTVTFMIFLILQFIFNLHFSTLNNLLEVVQFIFLVITL